MVGALAHDTSSEIQRIQLVEFQEDGMVEEPEIPNADPILDYLKVGSDGLLNDVKGFLERPVVIKTFDWTTSQQKLESLLASAVNLPNNWCGIPMILEKLRGFRYLRCDFVFKIQINAQPFNAGMLMAYFEPFKTQQEFTPSNIQTLSGRTGYRNTKMNLQRSTAINHRVPFMMPFSHFQLNDAIGLLGDFDVCVYSALTGTSDADGTVWVHAENIDIQMPTGLPPFDFPNPGKARGRAQSAVESVMKTEKESSDGTLSGTLSNVASIAKPFGDVPVIGDIAKPVSWAADAASGVASLFGFSKPADEAFDTTVTPQYIKNMANYDGDAKTKPLGLAAANAVAIPQGVYGTSDDEMAIATIVKDPIFLDSFTMSKDQNVDTQLWAWPVRPQTCRTRTGAGGSIYRENTRLSFLSESFKFWRGGLKFHVEIVKTVFHSGRIRIFYVPGLYIPIATDVDVDKCYSRIIDFRDTTEFEFTVPYVNNAPWSLIWETGGVQEANPTGYLFVQVLNALRNPTTASDSIEFMVSISADSDFQFGYMTDENQWFLADHALTNRGPAQSSDLFPASRMEGLNPNQIALGEAISSLRQCLKRYAPYPTLLPVPTLDAEAWKVRPYLESSGSSNVDNFASVFNKWAAMYRCYSGSMRVMLAQPARSESVPQTVGVTLDLLGSSILDNPDNYFSAYATSLFKSIYGAPRQNAFLDMEKAVEFDIPFYQRWPFLPTQLAQMKTYDPDSDARQSFVPYNHGTALIVDNKAELEVFRHIGEDFNFGYLVGAPVTYRNPTFKEVLTR
jgi:hypothetical protein